MLLLEISFRLDIYKISYFIIIDMKHIRYLRRQFLIGFCPLRRIILELPNELLKIGAQTFNWIFHQFLSIWPVYWNHKMKKVSFHLWNGVWDLATANVCFHNKISFSSSFLYKRLSKPKKKCLDFMLTLSLKFSKSFQLCWNI